MQITTYQSLISVVFAWAFFIIICEALNQLIRHAEPLEGIRAFLARNSNFLASLIQCGYCTSVWVAFSIAWILPPLLPVHQDLGSQYCSVASFINVYFWWFLNGVALHRLSNWFHDRIMNNSFKVIEGTQDE